MTGIRKVWQLEERCDGHREVWGGVTAVSNCDSPLAGVTIMRELWQLMERCDSHWQV